MAQSVIRKKCTVTAESPTSKTLTPTTNDKSPAVPITTIVINSSSTPSNFWDGSGRYEVIIRRL
jgi:hypothetical protein